MPHQCLTSFLRMIVSFFFKVTRDEASEVKRCLDRYEQCSRQIINFYKFIATFNRNTCTTLRTYLASLFNVNKIEGFGKYMGLPSITERNRRIVFAFIKDKLHHRLKN